MVGFGSEPIAFFAMEYIAEASPITVYAREQNLSIRDRLALFVRVCDAAHHGQAQGLVQEEGTRAVHGKVEHGKVPTSAPDNRCLIRQTFAKSARIRQVRH